MLRKGEFATVIIVILLIITLFLGVYLGGWELSSVLSYVPYFLLAGIAGTLAWGFRERIEDKLSPDSNKQDDENIRDHTKKLFIELDQQKTSSSIFGNPSWINSIQAYRYEPQLRQHLFTAHKREYSQLTQAEEADTSSKSLYKETSDEIIKKHDTTFQDFARAWGLMTITSSNPPKHPAFLILKETKIPQFYAKIDASGRYRVWYNDEPYSQPLPDKLSAEDWASKLKGIAQDMSVEVKKYQEVNQQAKKNECDFESLFKNLVDNILVGGDIDTKSEACDACLSFHSKKDAKRLKSELDKMK